MLEKWIYKYRDLIAYSFFGLASTLINVIIYHILSHTIMLGTMLSTVVAWIIAVLFAYITNRRFVFHSQTKDTWKILKELGSFFACRLGTEIIDIAAMFVLVVQLEYDDMLIKIAANIVVIICNYIASKFWIFQ